MSSDSERKWVGDGEGEGEGRKEMVIDQRSSKGVVPRFRWSLADWDKISISFFFCNFPDSCETTDLWRTFNRFGNVVDVYLSGRRTKSGKRFGFVRFKDCLNHRKMESELNSIWFGSYKLRVNLSKHSSRSSSNSGKIMEQPFDFQHMFQSNVRDGRSFRDSLIGRHDEFVHKKVQMDQSMESKSLNFDVPLSAHCSEEGLQVKDKPFMSIKLVATEQEWLNRCLVGELFLTSNVTKIEDLLKNDNISVTSIRSLGGKRILLECNTLGDRDKILTSANGILRKWFTWISTWSCAYSAVGRLAKLNCFGFPLQAWNKDNFCKIGELWGDVVEVDDQTINKSNLACGSLSILTKKWEFVSVIIGDRVYTVKVEEDRSVCVDRTCDQRCSSHMASRYSSSDFFSSGNDDFAYEHQSETSEEAGDLDRGVLGEFKSTNARQRVPSPVKKGRYNDNEKSVTIGNKANSKDFFEPEYLELGDPLTFGDVRLSSIIDSIFSVAQENSYKAVESLCSVSLCFSNNVDVSGDEGNDILLNKFDEDPKKIAVDVMEDDFCKDNQLKDVEPGVGMMPSAVITKKRRSNNSSKFSVVRALQLCRVKEGCFFDPKYRADLRKKLRNQLKDFEYDFSVDKSLVSKVRQPRRYVDIFESDLEHFANNQCVNQIGILCDRGIWKFGG